MRSDQEEMLYLRPAEMTDMDLLFEWANDREVRENAFCTDRISMEEHRKWFLNLLHDMNQKQYILMLGNEPAGQVRLTVCGEFAEIDYSISSDKRGQGYGRKILCLAADEVRSGVLPVRKLAGKVKKGNIISERCFTGSGFEEKFKQFEMDCTERSR